MTRLKVLISLIGLSIDPTLVEFVQKHLELNYFSKLLFNLSHQVLILIVFFLSIKKKQLLNQKIIKLISIREKKLNFKMIMLFLCKKKNKIIIKDIL